MKDLKEIVSEYDVEDYLVYPDYSRMKGYEFNTKNYPANCFYYKNESELERMQNLYYDKCTDANTATIKLLIEDIVSNESGIDEDELYDFLCEETEDYLETYDVQFIEHASVKEAVKEAKDLEELKVELEKVLLIEESEDLLCAADNIFTDNIEWQKIMRSIDWFGNDITIEEAIKNMDAKALLIKEGIKQII